MTTHKIKAAMFAAIPKGITKISRSGINVVFARPVLGRCDLSSDEKIALAQSATAGIDHSSVTPEQLQAYEQWSEDVYRARQIADARFQITHAFGYQRGHSITPSNRVSLIDGWGEIVEFEVFERVEYWDKNEKNRIGGLGAVCTRADYEKINAYIDRLRKKHPEYSGARVQDNNQGGGHE